MTDIGTAAIDGLLILFTVKIFPYMMIGILAGMFFGLVPGLSGLTGLGLLIPFAIGKPPEVAFAVPLDGARGVLLSSDFRIQFTNDMNVASFDRNIDLLYAVDDGMSNPFPDMQIRYEKADRILVVLPGQTLEPSKEVILILYNGIVDINGKPLVVTAPEDEFPDAAVILRYFTGKR